jgi:glycolate oxidase FAD binding subunit
MGTLVATLEALLTAEQVVSHEAMATDLAQSLGGTTEAGSLPAAVVYPQTEAELAELMACAYHHRWRVLPYGSGSKLPWGGLAPGFDLAICTQRLNQVIDHAVGDMTLTAAAGLKLADLQPQLAHHNQFLAVDPAFPGQATLGGIVATADTGALRQRYNSVRDMLIGITFVRHDGEVAKAGGRVVKNVAGYDLMKLMTGAYGSLGLISQLTFRLYPIPAASKTVVVTGTAADIERLTAELRQSALTPTALDLLSPPLAHALGYDSTFALVARFQANPPGVDEQVKMVTEMVTEPLSWRIVEDHDEADFWQRENAALFPSSGLGCRQGEETVIAKIGVLPARALGLLTRLQGQVPANATARIHAGSGIGTLNLPAAVATPDLLQTLRHWCETDQGYLTILQAPRSLKQSLDVWGISDRALPLMQSIKTKFDPHNLLNGGRFLA